MNMTRFIYFDGLTVIRTSNSACPRIIEIVGRAYGM